MEETTDYEHLDQMATEANRLSDRAQGVYFTLNTLKTDLLERNRYQTARSKEGMTTSDNDVLRRRWLFIDIDPDKPSREVSSTDEEKARARLMAEGVRGLLHDRGWPDPIPGDSGNG